MNRKCCNAMNTFHNTPGRFALDPRQESYIFMCSCVTSTKSPASGAGNVTELSLTSEAGTVREAVCAYFCLCSNGGGGAYVAVSIT